MCVCVCQTVTRSDISWWWCPKSVRMPGMHSPQLANHSWNPQERVTMRGGGTTTIFVRLLVDVRAEIWYFLHSKHRLTGSWKESCSAARQRHRDMREVEGDWKVRVLYLRCGCKLPGPLTGWVPKTSDRWPAVPESLDRWQLGLWVAQMWAAWLKWFPWRRETLAQGSVKLLLGKRRWCHYQGDITADFAGQTAENMFSHV